MEKGQARNGGGSGRGHPVGNMDFDFVDLTTSPKRTKPAGNNFITLLSSSASEELEILPAESRKRQSPTVNGSTAKRLPVRSASDDFKYPAPSAASGPFPTSQGVSGSVPGRSRAEPPIGCRLGDSVVLLGLSSASFNGCFGILGNPTEQGRFEVHLDDGKTVSIKPENIYPTSTMNSRPSASSSSHLPATGPTPKINPTAGPAPTPAPASIPRPAPNPVRPPVAAPAPAPAAPAVTTPASPGDDTPRKRIPWTEEETDLLRHGVQVYGKGNWVEILARYPFHPSRTAGRLKDRYRTISSAPASAGGSAARPAPSPAPVAPNANPAAPSSSRPAPARSAPEPAAAPGPQPRARARAGPAGTGPARLRRLFEQQYRRKTCSKAEALAQLVCIVDRAILNQLGGPFLVNSLQLRSARIEIASNPVPASILWVRERHDLDEAASLATVPIQVVTTIAREDTPMLLVRWEAAAFYDMLIAGTLTNMAQGVLQEAGARRVTLLLEGLDIFMKQRFASRVRGQAGDPVLDKQSLIRAVVYLEIEAGISVRQTAGIAESVEFVLRFSTQIGLLPYRRAEVFDSFCAEAVQKKARGSPAEVWVAQLAQLPGISEAKARSITAVYPSPAALLAALRNGGPELLADLPVPGQSSRLGPAASRKVWSMFTSRNPREALN